jgi:hypothetical protein
MRRLPPRRRLAIARGIMLAELQEKMTKLKIDFKNPMP